MFYEVDRQGRKHSSGIFCLECSIELLDKLKGRLEWFHAEWGWKGYIHPEARYKLEKDGLVHAEYDTQSMEISRTGLKSRKIGRTEVLEILEEICRRTDV